MWSKPCKWCGRFRTTPCSLNHKFSTHVYLPWPKDEALECYPCFAYNRMKFNKEQKKEFEQELRGKNAEPRRAAHLEQVKMWEAAYNESATGRVTRHDLGMDAQVSIENKSGVKMEFCMGVLWPVALYTADTGKKPTKCQLQTFGEGADAMTGALLVCRGELWPKQVLSQQDSGVRQTSIHLCRFLSGVSHLS